MSFSHRRLLVTGGAGFIGSHLCNRLIGLNAHVVCLDNFLTGSRTNIEHLIDSPRFETLCHDVIFPIDVDVHEIYNLACPASPLYYQVDPIRTVQTCVMGSINMLELSRTTGATVLQASTSEVYGDPQTHPQTEEYWGHVNPNGIRSCYDEGKRCAETLFADYRRQHLMNTKVARIFNTYGPNMTVDDGRVVSNFIVQALRGEPMTVYGDGRQTRSFCYVSDVVEGMVRLMETSADYGGPVNLGNPHEIAIGDLAEKIRDLVGSGSEIHCLARPADDPARRCPDIGRARSDLGWTPRVALDDGLRRTIAYFEAALQVSADDADDAPRLRAVGDGV
jgi:UDP-glucuronate decarboxylase